MKTYVAFTVDVDPDLNMPVTGKKTPVTKVHGRALEPQFDMAGEGLVSLVKLLDRMAIPATFFFEARAAETLSTKIDLPALMAQHEVACHSHRHEDYTGADTGAPLSEHERREAIGTSRDILRHLFNRTPEGFRAPYLHIDSALIDMLAEFGFTYDSSDTAFIHAPSPIPPQRIRPANNAYGSLFELPLSEWPDADERKMSSYFWALHEGARPTKEYIDMIERASYDANDGIIVLATHSWHPFATFTSGILSREAKLQSLKQVAYILDKIKKLDSVEFIRLDTYVKTVASQHRDEF